MAANIVFTYTGGEINDLAKEWYCYVYEYDKQGHKKRKKIMGHVNQYNNVDERLHAVELLKREIENGTYSGRKTIKEKIFVAYVHDYFAEKSLELKKKSLSGITSSLNIFIQYLNENRKPNILPSKIDTNEINKYKTWILKKGNGNRTVNNYVDYLSAFFNWLQQKTKIENPCKKFKHLPARSETHVVYSGEQMKLINDYCNQYDPLLGFYLRFVGLVVLRPNEIRTIQIGDIDFEKYTVNVSAAHAKGNRKKEKIIPKPMHQLIKAVQHLPKHYYLFGEGGLPGDCACGINFFTRRFKKIKDLHGWNIHHTIYSIKHTMIRNLFENGVLPHEILPLTDHTTVAALESYFRNIGALKQKDLSDKITIKL